MNSNLDISGVYLDAETDGLYGRVWAICAVKIDQNGNETSRFEAREENYIPANQWVRDNCYHHNQGIKETPTLLADFAQWWNLRKGSGRVWAHMPCPVEAGLFIELVRQRLIGEFNGPYPLMDVSPLLMLKGFEPDSIDAAVDQLGVRPEGSAHDCRYDVAATIAFMKAIR